MENNYDKITSLVPEGEYFDASSAVNEGIFITAGHLANIEVSLKNQDTVVTQMQEQINQAAAANTTAQETITAHETTIADQNKKITDLQAEIADLKKKPANDFTQTGKEKDEHGGGETKVVDAVTEEANKMRAAMGKPAV